MINLGSGNLPPPPPASFALVPQKNQALPPPNQALPPPPAPMHSAMYTPSPAIQQNRIAVHTSGQNSTGSSQVPGVKERVVQLAAVKQNIIPRTVDDFANIQSDVAGKTAFFERVKLVTQDLRERVIPQQFDEVKNSIRTEINSFNTQDVQDLQAVFKEVEGYFGNFMMSDEEIAKRCNADEEVLNQFKAEPSKIFKIPKGMSIQKAYALLYVFCCYKKWREGVLESRSTGTRQNPLMNHFYYFGKYHPMIDQLFPSGTNFKAKYLDQFYHTLPGVEATPGVYLRVLEWGLIIFDRKKKNDQVYLKLDFSNYCILGPQNEEEIRNAPPFAAAGAPRSEPPSRVPEFVTKYLSGS